MKMICKIAAIL